MELDKDFNEFVKLLGDNRVRFLVVGGYAVAAHGLPRYTGDFDAWIWLDAGNAELLITALDEFGFGGLGLTAGDFIEPGVVVQLGYPPNRIDILTSIDGVNFDEAWQRRFEIEIDGRTVSFIGRHDLIVNKTAAGRPQDLADVARLSEGQAS